MQSLKKIHAWAQIKVPLSLAVFIEELPLPKETQGCG